MFHVPNQYRIREGFAKSDDSYGNNGAFNVMTKGDIYFQCIASDGAGWEHVSVTMCNKNYPSITSIPSWLMMCLIKDIFWDKEDCVVQFHPPMSEYINEQTNVLHLWRPIGYNIMTPPAILVGTKKKK